MYRSHKLGRSFRGYTSVIHLSISKSITKLITFRRAKDAGMHDLPLPDIANRAQFVLSILPPSDAFSFAQQFHDASPASTPNPNKSVIFADCNAVNPDTVKRIASLFSPSQNIRFVDAGIIGGPPSGDYDPTFYASTSADDTGVLDAFLGLSKYGLKISPLTGEGVGIGDASALKMSYAVSSTTSLIWYRLWNLYPGYHKRHNRPIHYDDSR